MSLTVRTVSASLTEGTTVLAFEQGALTNSSFTIIGYTFVDSDGNAALLDPATAFTLYTTTGFSVTVTVNGTFTAGVVGTDSATAVSGTDIITLSVIKEYLNISHTSDDTFLSRWIGIVTSSIEKYIFGCVVQRDVSIIVDGSGDYTQPIPRPYLPLISMKDSAITDIQYRIRPIDAWQNLYTDSAQLGYILISAHEPFQIQVYDRIIPYGLQNVKLALTVGYATIPQDFTSVCIEAVAEKWEESRRLVGRLGKTSVSDNQTGTSGTTSYFELSKRHQGILDMYKRELDNWVPSGFGSTIAGMMR